jgi:hypothetical protein
MKNPSYCWPSSANQKSRTDAPGRRNISLYWPANWLGSMPVQYPRRCADLKAGNVDASRQRRTTRGCWRGWS